ncbi:MAG: T9SS type A sorting domain-containing protein [Balneolaceae bacterium]
MKFRQILSIVCVCIFFSTDAFSQRITYANYGSQEYVKVDSLIYTSGQGSITVQKITPDDWTEPVGNPIFQLKRPRGVSNPLNGYVYFAGDDGFIAKVEVSDEHDFDYGIVQNPFSENLTDIELSGERLIISGENGFVAYSDDEGQNWTKVPIGSTGYLSNIVNDFDRLFITGHNGLLIASDDNGTTWDRVGVDADRDIHDLHMLSNGTGFAVGNNGLLLYTANEGASWDTYSTFGLYTDLRSIDFYDDNNGIFGGEGGTIYRTTDGGDSWFYAGSFVGTQNILNLELFEPYQFEVATSAIQSFEFDITERLNTSMRIAWLALNSLDNIGLAVTADWTTSSWGNFGMHLLGTEPRVTFPNTNANSSMSEYINTWNTSYTAISNAQESVDELVNDLSPLDEAEKILYEGLSNFVQGLGYANLGLKFDQAEILSDAAAKIKPDDNFSMNFTPSSITINKEEINPDDEIFSSSVPVFFKRDNQQLQKIVSSTVTFEPYEIVLEEAKNHLLEAQSMFDSAVGLDGSLNMPDEFINGFGGMTAESFSEMINTLVAEIEVFKARNSDATTDWDEVLTLTQDGASEDYFPESNFDNWYSNAVTYYSYNAFTRVDQKIIAMLDDSQPTSWPEDGTTPPQATSDDNRLESYFIYTPSITFNPARGLYFFSQYTWGKFSYLDNWGGGGDGTGPMPFVHKASNDLLRAEAIIRTGGDKTVAAGLINNSRNGNGNLSSLTGAETEQELMDAIYYEWMIEVGPQGLGSISWFNNRRLDKLQEGTLTQLPVPGPILENYGMDNYTFGGVVEANVDFKVLSPERLETLVSLEPTIEWAGDADASTYTLRFNQGGSANDPILFEKTGLTDTSYTVTLDDAELDYYTNYSVLISAVNESEEVYLTTHANSFTTIDTLMNAPQAVNPTNNATDTPTRITFYWDLDPGNSRSQLAGFNNYQHHVQVSTSSDFNSLVIDETINPEEEPGQTGTYWWSQMATYDGFDNDTEYFWRIASINEAGASDWSDTFSFTTLPDNSDGILQLTSPTNDATDVSLPAVFEWTSAEGANGYELQASNAVDFSKSITLTGLSQTSVTVPEVLSDITYYWRVRAVYNNVPGEWTTIQSFKTELPVPDTPNWEPADGATVEESLVEFSWGESNYAETYSIQVSDVNDFSSLISEASDLTDRSHQVNDLENGTYYWRVSATNASGTSDWSEASEFQVVSTSNELNKGDIPGSYVLEQNYPNPFNPTTTIKFGVPQAADVQITVYNMLGQNVATLTSGRKQAGFHTVTFDASMLSSGIYVYMLKAGNYTETRQLTLIK